MKDWQIRVNNNSALWREVERINTAYRSYAFDSINCGIAFEYSKTTSGAKFTQSFSLEPRSESLKRIEGDRFDFGKYLVNQILENMGVYDSLVKKHLNSFEAYVQYKSEITITFERHRLFKKDDYDNTPKPKRNFLARFFVDDSTHESYRYSEFSEKQRYEEEMLKKFTYNPEFPYVLLHLEAVTPWKYHKKDFQYSFSDIVTCYEWAVGKKGHMTFVEEQRRIVTDSLRYDVLKRDGFRCRVCGATVSDGAKLEVDHIIPVSKGGKSTMDNLQTLCERCNRGKRDKI